MTKPLYTTITYLILILLTSVGVSMATPVTYYMKFKANQMKCYLYINDVYIYHTEGIPRLISFGHGVTEYLQQGKNIVTLFVDNGAEYIPASEIDNGYCEVEVIALVANEEGDVESKVVNHMRHTYIPKPEDSESLFPYHLSTAESNLKLDSMIAPNYIQVTELPYKYDADDEPVQWIQSERELIVHHSHPMSWADRSTPFENTEANKRKLWEKYQEIKRAINRKDKRAIRTLAEPGVSDMARIFGKSAEDYFETAFNDTIKEFFEVDTNYYKDEHLPYDDYELEIYAEGKLFRLNRKGYLISSPLRWHNPFNQESLIYNPLFTYINGKIVMAKF